MYFTLIYYLQIKINIVRKKNGLFKWILCTTITMIKKSLDRAMKGAIALDAKGFKGVLFCGPWTA